MMSPDERQLLAGLFDRTRAASANPRDKEAEAFIAEAVREQPYATYLLAQAVIVQDQALGAANEKLQQLEARIHELESAQANNSGSFLGGLFGGGRPAAPTSVPSAGAAPSPWGRQQAAQPPMQQGQPYGQQQPQQGGMFGGGGGGFLKGALGAAAGVAGGMLLANSISGLLNQNSASNSLGIGSGLGAGDSNQASLGGNQGAGDSGGLMGGIFPASYNESSEDSGFYGSSDDSSDI
jgi:hypothetical protein